jgi:hypothetical protein
MAGILLNGLRCCLVVLVFLAPPGQANERPWRLGAAVATPGWLTVEGSYRLRYGYLDNTFRVIGPGHDELMSSRLRLHFRADAANGYAGVELQDSRALLDSALTPVGVDDVNALEPLRAYIGYRTAGLDVQVGRMTMEHGSRRLVSRNRFRNATIIYTGALVRWTVPDSHRLEAFLTMPAAALPNNLERERLRNNEFELDQEHWERIFWGFYLSELQISDSLAAAGYVYGIREQDRPSLPTRNRDFLTAGLRLVYSAGSRAAEIEAAYQFGTSRATLLPDDTTDLDVRAWLLHAEVGQDLGDNWDTSLLLRFDYATGDDDPGDGEFNRFDTLFGDRRWEFGPTGIFGALTRMNLVSPGIALRMHPTASTDVWFDYRAAWLESDRDFMPTAGLRDADGRSGSFIGHQVDARWRWVALPQNVSLEFGVAYLWKGAFLENAPGAPPAGDTAYGYVSTTLTF